MGSSFSALFVALYIAHHVGDYWVQTSWQAANKEAMVRACVAHVCSYTAILFAALAVVAHGIDADLSVGRVCVALTLISSTHYLADRRTFLRRLALACRHDREWLDSGGLAFLDQSWHIAWLGVAALILT